MPIEFFSSISNWITKRGMRAPTCPSGFINTPTADFKPEKDQRKLLHGKLSVHLLQSIFRSAPIGIGLVSDRILLWVNDRVCVITGYSREELIGQSARMLYPTEKEFLRVGKEKYEQIRLTGRGTIETQFRKKDGRIIDILLCSSPLDPSNFKKGVTFTVLDITDRKTAEKALRIERDLGLDLSLAGSMQDVLHLCLHAALEGTGLDCGGIYLVEERTGGLTLTYHTGLCPEFISMVSRYGPQESETKLVMAGNPVYVNFEQMCQSVFSREISFEKIRAFAVIPIKHQGKVIACINAGSHKFDDIPPNSRTLMETIASFIGEAITVKQFEHQLNYQANYDPLTELPNRVLAYDRLTQAVRLAEWGRHLMAVMFVDLDQFKLINDTLGHIVGDTLLIQVSERIHSCLRGNDTLARFSGDDFLILMPEISNSNEADRMAKKIRGAFLNPFQLGEREIFVSPTIGIALYPSDGTDPDSLLKNADSALHKAKGTSRNTVQFFSREFNDRANQRMEMETQLRHALEKKEMTLHYQPLMDARSGQLCGLEALARWRNEKLGEILPEHFIPLGEETGLIVSMDEWVLYEACKQAKFLQDKLGFPLHLSVNVSSRQIESPGFIDSVKNSLELTGFSPTSLALEVTESLLLDPLPTTQKTLEQINAMGVKLSLDDFGTGFSALSYLTKYSFQNLKIDRSFVADLDKEGKNLSLTQAIISLGHGLGMVVVGEGVETAEQLEILKNQGCDMLQGNYISRPLPAVELLNLAWPVSVG